jgi:hypothetical protein
VTTQHTESALALYSHYVWRTVLLMNARELHEGAIVFDGLIIAKWSREVFADMRRGGLTAAKELRKKVRSDPNLHT